MVLPVVLSGNVVEGAKRGRELGFPTANLDLALTELQVLEDGVYAGKVEIAESGKTYRGAFSLGTNITFGKELRKLEVYLLDFSGNLYGKKLIVNLVTKLRNQLKYSSIEELIDQIKLDVEEVKKIINLA